MLSRNINQSDTFVVLIKIRLSASLLFTLTYARTPIHTHTLMQTHIYVCVYGCMGWINLSKRLFLALESTGNLFNWLPLISEIEYIREIMNMTMNTTAL